MSLIYLDHHSTTPLDPDVLSAMLPMMTEHFANAGSISHEAGRLVAQRVDQARASIASQMGAADDEIVFTSGATESNNLALFGVCLHPRQKRRKVISAVTEHKAILDPLQRLASQGFDVHLVDVLPQSSSYPGCIDLDRMESLIDDQTAMVTVMLANNEIGTVQPIAELAKLCRKFDCVLHTDAAQAIGRMNIHVDHLDVDLLSFSGHKMYGPKGVGGLFVRRRGRRVRLQSQIVGGGQQQNMRSGTLNTPAIVGMAAALAKCYQLNGWATVGWADGKLAVGAEEKRLAGLRGRFFGQLSERLGVQLNGPVLTDESGMPSGQRLAGNLNVCFAPVEGQSLMMLLPHVAMSSGSACTTTDPRPSHVLEALGLSVEQTRSSLRFGFGRYNTERDIDAAAQGLIDACLELRKLL